MPVPWRIPPKATKANTTVSKNSPTNVEPISRSHSFSPFVLIFNFANTNEFRNEPVKNAAKLAATILGKNPRTASYDAWAVYSGAGGHIAHDRKRRHCQQHNTKCRPNRPPRVFIAVNFRQNVAQNIGKWKQHRATVGSNKTARSYL